MGYKQLHLFSAAELEKLEVPQTVEWEMFVKKTAGATYSDQPGNTPQLSKKKRRKKRTNEH